MSINHGKLSTEPRNKKLWRKEYELRVAYELAGTMPIDDLLIEVNKVSKVKRTKDQLRNKAAKMGWSLAYTPVERG